MITLQTNLSLSLSISMNLFNGHNKIFAFEFHAVADVQRLDHSSDWRLNDHFHFHGGQNNQRLALLDPVANLDANV